MTKFAMLVLAMAAPTAAIAADTPPTADPNEVICRTVSATGSRLATSRRCATRAQWAEDERTQRAQLAERQTRQTQPSCMNPAERMRVNGRYASSAMGGSCGY